jgi:hypothetical protein
MDLKYPYLRSLMKYLVPFCGGRRNPTVLVTWKRRVEAETEERGQHISVMNRHSGRRSPQRAFLVMGSRPFFFGVLVGSLNCT